MKLKNVLTEAQLEMFIWENRDVIHEKGIPKFYRNTICQFRLPTRKIIDVFSYQIDEAVLKFRIVELKKQDFFWDGLTQALTYCNHVLYLTQNKFKKVEFDVLLIGDYVRSSTLSFAKNLISCPVYFFEYVLGFDGLTFTERKWEEVKNNEVKNEDDFFNTLCNPMVNDFGESDNPIQKVLATP